MASASTCSAGETLGLVGESGCGKTSAGRALLRLTEPTSGQVTFEGTDVVTATGPDLRKLRRKMQMVFQDPYASLNPRQSVGELIAEPIRVHGLRAGRSGARPGGRADRPRRPARQRHRRLSARVLRRAAPAHRHRPRAGGRAQFLVCDEPVSALDVSIQAQVINLLEDLQDELGLTYLFIAHDLSVVRHISHRVAVMYLGKIVEIATSASLYAQPLAPLHPRADVGGADPRP